MSEISEFSKSKYKYNYLQFTVTLAEKKKIKDFIQNESFKTISEFLRRIIFDYIRRKENPELFLSYYNDFINPLFIEKMVENIKRILKNQETILHKELKYKELKKRIIALEKVIESEELTRKREEILELLKMHNSLSLTEIQEKTKISEALIFKIITDTRFFKITNAGMLSLR